MRGYDCLDGRSMICRVCLCDDRRKWMQETGTCEACGPRQSRLDNSIFHGFQVEAIIGVALHRLNLGLKWITEAAARDKGHTPSWELVRETMGHAEYSLAETDEVLAWVESLAAKPHQECTDYECDILAVVRRRYVSTPEHFALAAGIAHAWQKSIKPPAPVEPEATGEWLGELKQRIDVKGCQCTLVLALGTNPDHPEWGDRFCIKFTAAAGHELTWFTGSGGKFDPKVGETYDVRCTVTKHDVFEGRKQTIVSRCAQCT